jgi:hypothetical protein
MTQLHSTGAVGLRTTCERCGRERAAARRRLHRCTGGGAGKSTAGPHRRVDGGARMARWRGEGDDTMTYWATVAWTMLGHARLGGDWCGGGGSGRSASGANSGAQLRTTVAGSARGEATVGCRGVGAARAGPRREHSAWQPRGESALTVGPDAGSNG